VQATPALAQRYVGISAPQNAEEWERLKTLMRLALAAAVRLREERSREREEAKDASEQR